MFDVSDLLGLLRIGKKHNGVLVCARDPPTRKAEAPPTVMTPTASALLSRKTCSSTRARAMGPRAHPQALS